MSGKAAPRERLETTKGPVVPIITVGELPERPDPTTLIRERILRLVRQSGDSESWWLLRQCLGGRVRAAAFRQHAEELLAEGLLMEVTLARHDLRDPQHLLVLPGHTSTPP